MIETGRVKAWWQERELEVGSGLRWRLGPLELELYRLEGEWQLAHRQLTEGSYDSALSSVTPASPGESDGEQLERFVTAKTGSKVSLLPRAADRSVVVRPRLPLHLLPGQGAKIYVSSPAWVNVMVGRPLQSIFEVPVKRLSDTWFGPNTLEGEIAYAIKTQGRVLIDEVQRRNYRIITPTKVQNKGQDVLLIDRINLPVPYLSVYATEDGSLWSESVELVRTEGSEMATLDLGRGAPREGKGAKRLSEPRQVAEKNFLVRAFTDLLKPFHGED